MHTAYLCVASPGQPTVCPPHTTKKRTNGINWVKRLEARTVMSLAAAWDSPAGLSLSSVRWAIGTKNSAGGMTAISASEARVRVRAYLPKSPAGVPPLLSLNG